MSQVSKLLVMFTLAAFASFVEAADTCNPIRPNGLSAEAVDALVVRKVAEGLQVPTERVDLRKTLRQIDPTGDVLMHYAFFVVGIGEALAFDSAAAFDNANRATGSSHPTEGITVATMQELARKAYFSGHDALPPEAPTGATFRTRRFSVLVPGPPHDWSLVVCNSDQFAFRSANSESSGVYSAVARDISMELYKDAATFLAQVKGAVASVAPAGYAIDSVDVKLIERTGPPCALLSAVAKGPGSSDSRYTLFGQFCYDSKFPHLGYAALFSHSGRAPAELIRERAMSFLGGVRAAR